MPGFWLGTSRRYIGSTTPLDSGPVSEYAASFCRNGELEGRSICVENQGFSGGWGRGLSSVPAAPHPGGGRAPALHFPPPPLVVSLARSSLFWAPTRAPKETLGFAVWLPYATDSWITAPFQGTGHAFVQRRESQERLPINSSLEVWFRLPTHTAHPDGAH